MNEFELRNSKYDTYLTNPVIYTDLHKNVAMTHLISSLDLMQRISDEVFDKINRVILEKKVRLENLKSRLYRAAKIIQSLEKTPKALTIKCKREYPNCKNDNSETEHTSIYYNDVCDFSLVRNLSMNKEDFNTKPFNPSSVLGKNPDVGEVIIKG